MKFDLKYDSRLKTLKHLENLLQEGEKHYEKFKILWDDYLEKETGDCYKLSILSFQMETNSEVTKTLKEEIQKIKIELSN